MKIKRSLLFGCFVPVVINFFLLLTMQTKVQLLDGPEVSLFGFPLPWKAQPWYTSLLYEIFLLNLLADVLVYAAIVFLLFCLAMRYVHTILFSRKLIFIYYLTVCFALAGHIIQ
jgi:hypothetical protein